MRVHVGMAVRGAPVWRVVVITILLGGSLAGAPAAAKQRPAASGRAKAQPLSIVAVQPGVDPAQAARDLGVAPAFIFRHVLNGFAAALPASAARVARSRQIRSVGPDPEVHASGQRISTGIRRIAADKSPLAQIDGHEGPAIDVDVAVLDTGVSGRADLNVVGGTNVFTASDDGKDCGASSDDTTDKNGHGTNVAGIIGAIDNDMGVVGVAPGARLWSVKVLDAKGTGTWSSVICGLDWVDAHRDTIDVVNLSFGGPLEGGDTDCETAAPTGLHAATCKLVNADDIAVVVAAGNQHKDATGYAPAAYDEVITVAALADADGKPGGNGGKTCDGSRDDTLARFSNFGPDIDIVAPGSCIVSLGIKKKGLSRYSGTSQATPHVAGAIALFLASANPTPGSRVAAARAWLATTASQPMLAAKKGRDGPPLTAPALYLGGT
ncbi:MAG TPA: S8 family serine peptidase [Thermomicrobiales bacterium]|nr:S8 family serine peptidase [Thermomicrobiales bacterium]